MKSPKTRSDAFIKTDVQVVLETRIDVWCAVNSVATAFHTKLYFISLNIKTFKQMNVDGREFSASNSCL